MILYLTAPHNWFTAYDHLTDKGLENIAKSIEIDEDLIKMISDIIIFKKWLPNFETLKKKIDEVILGKSYILPEFSQLKLMLESFVSDKGVPYNLFPNWWEEELSGNMNICIKMREKPEVKIIKRIIIYSIMEQRFKKNKIDKELAKNKVKQENKWYSEEKFDLLLWNNS